MEKVSWIKDTNSGKWIKLANLNTKEIHNMSIKALYPVPDLRRSLIYGMVLFTVTTVLKIRLEKKRKIKDTGNK